MYLKNIRHMTSKIHSHVIKNSLESKLITKTKNNLVFEYF